MLPLFTARLVLRRFVENDLPAFHAYRNDPILARHQSWEAFNLTEAAAFIHEHQAKGAGLPGQWLQIAIVRRDSDELIGDCAFQVHAEDIRQATVGITLAQEYQQQGYAAEAMTCLLQHLFETMKLHRVMADTDPGNTASMKLLERLGLRHEGHLKQSLWFKGRWADEYLYAILSDEWRAKASARHKASSEP
jgi:RimJ/RimL family protein N-acetyltransferase